MLNPIDQSIKCTIYPPPTPAEVIKVFYCMAIQRMFLMLKTGSICIYNIDRETGTLESLSESKQLKDYEGKSMNQAITCIKNCSIEPPQHDCEIPPDLYKYVEPHNPDYDFVQDMDGGHILDQFLVIGLNKGTVIFVKVNNLSHIYARFSIHREAIC